VTVFITGGAGFIGSHVASDFLSNGWDVTVYDMFHQYTVPPDRTHSENFQYRFNHLLKGATVVRGSTESRDELRRKLTAANPEYIIHLAAMPLAGLADQQPEEALRSIVEGTVNLLDVSRDLPRLTKVIYVSSSMAYGHFEMTPVPETAKKDPIDIYGAMKLAGEVLVRAYSRRFGIPSVIVRPSAVYGPGDNNGRVVRMLAERALQGRVLITEEPDTTFLDFTYVTDVARGLCLAALTPEAVGEDFNITCGQGRSITELTNVLRRHFPALEVEVRPRSESYRPVRGTLDISKARQLLGYSPQVCLEDGVINYLDYMHTYNQSIVSPAAPAAV
jgi:nucleoside-diphosphate-sugar epimerase